MKIEMKLVLSLVLGYIVAYSSLGFGSIIDKGFFPWSFLIFFLLDILLIFCIFSINSINKKIKLTEGLKKAFYFAFIIIIILHIYSANMGQKLGPTKTEISETRVSVSTNEFLIQVNLILLFFIAIISIFLALFLDLNKKIKNILKTYSYWIVLLGSSIILTIILHPIVSIFYMIIAWS